MAKRPAKKVGSKKTSKKTIKKTTKKAVNVKKEDITKDEAIENKRFVVLINLVRGSKNQNKVNQAFEEILENLSPRIQGMVNKFTIRGLDPNDVMQEALYALRYKAIKDYDKTRGTVVGVAPFDRFALLCIRRHLSTEFKSSLQNNRKKVLNQSISLNQESRGNNDDLSLINIIPSGDGNILEEVQEKEYFNGLMSNLFKSLSRFEREVLILYSQRFTYEEISDKINENRVKIIVNVKGIDNALSRIKNKAKVIITQYEKKHD